MTMTIFMESTASQEWCNEISLLDIRRPRDPVQHSVILPSAQISHIDKNEPAAEGS